MTGAIFVNSRLSPEPCDEDMRLVDYLRDQCGITSCRAGCHVGRCGTCMVLVQNEALNACLVRMRRFSQNDKVFSIITTEGLNTIPEGRSVQEIAKRWNAFQCGYCAPGFLIAATGYLLSTKTPDLNGMITAISGNICRCTGYASIQHAMSELLASRAGQKGHVD